MSRSINVHRSGFTLVELLVVISIIALLISILLPSLSQARATARMVKCQSVQKQYGTASAMYTNAFPSWALPDTTPSDHEYASGGFVRWPFNPHFQKTLNLSSDNVPVSIIREYSFLSGMVCPDAWVAMERYTDPDWPERRHREGMGHNTRQNGGGWPDYDKDIGAHWRSDIKMPSEKLEFVDANRYHVGIHTAGQYDVYGELPGWESSNNLLAPRHLYEPGGGMGNVGFFDGHSESLSREELTASPTWKLWDPLD